MPDEEAAQEVERVIRELEITPFRNRPVHALSGGQKKQVSIADILVMHPDVIILDEPAAALDPKHTALVNDAVNQMTADGITVMMSTHDVNFAFEWADEIVLLDQGQVLMQGDPVQVFSNQTALSRANLEQPAVLQLFDSLCKKGILKNTLPVPKTLRELEEYIAGVTIDRSVQGYREFSRTRKAILVVSFGTSFEETRKVTIDAIEQEIARAYPDCTVYRAWTSKMILKKLMKRDGIHYDNVKEAFARMREDGITDVIVQPTHVINGIENDLMTQDALAYKKDFHSILFGDPLLTTVEDNDYVIRAIREEFADLKEDEVLVLMGHGTTHYSNSIYAALDYTFKDRGCPNIFLGTVEAYPSMQSLLHMVEKYNPRRVVLAPFMIVAGDHAKNDMAGDDPESWRCQFEAAGFPVSCVLKGLGEYPSIRRLFVDHVQAAVEKAEAED